MRPASGADALARALQMAGVTHVFGLPGTQNAALYSALAHTDIRTVVAGSELMAAFMANGFNRAGGGLPVVATIPGPGFTYALTGFAEAAHDNAALLLMTGAPEEPPGRRFDLQVIGQVGMVHGLARACHRLATVADIGQVIGTARDDAFVRGAGPVLLEIGKNVLGSPFSGALEVPDAATLAEPDADTLDELAERLLTARRVVILAGQGTNRAARQLHDLVDRRPAMVMTTLSARGVLPESHPWSLAFDFLACSVGKMNRLLEDADFVLVLGCRTSHNGTGGFALQLPAPTTALVDLDPEVLAENAALRWTVRGSVDRVLDGLLTRLGARRVDSDWSPDDVASWRDGLRRAPPASPAEPEFPGVTDGSARRFFDALQRCLPPASLVVTDTGQHQIMARRHLRIESPGGLLAPSDFQSMGFGVPAAIGAALAQPERPVLAIVGDGGLLMSGLELATAVREGVQLTVVVFRDGYLGQIRSQQARSGVGESGVQLATVDFEALAKATGAAYLCVDDDAAQTLRNAMANPGVTLVDVPLKASAAMQRERREGDLRQRARRVLGPRAAAWIRRAIQRD